MPRFIALWYVEFLLLFKIKQGGEDGIRLFYLFCCFLLSLFEGLTLIWQSYAKIATSYHIVFLYLRHQLADSPLKRVKHTFWLTLPLIL